MLNKSCTVFVPKKGPVVCSPARDKACSYDKPNMSLVLSMPPLPRRLRRYERSANLCQMKPFQKPEPHSLCAIILHSGVASTQHLSLLCCFLCRLLCLRQATLQIPGIRQRGLRRARTKRGRRGVPADALRKQIVHYDPARRAD